MKPRFFATPQDFRAWLAKRHATESELLVGFWKTHTGKPSLTWPESVDEALCAGWIDGVRKSLGEDSYTIRFTPRKPGSTWSAVNVKRMQGLIAEGRVLPAGHAAFEARKDHKTATYSYENRPETLPPDAQKRLRADKAAWGWWQSQSPSYRRTATWWVVSAKREATREKRLAQLIADCAQGRPIKPLSY
jgi:uncharacterized protein YdeI (YjbR/CyaY-like superfamily)